MPAISLHALSGVPDIKPDDDLAVIVVDAIARNQIMPAPNDIVILAQKIVSKSEGRYVDLATVEASQEAIKLASVCRKDPRLVELILRESDSVIRCVPNVIIVRHRLGLVLANAGIDQSNLPGNLDSSHALLLPLDPDESANRLRVELEGHFGHSCGVAIIDSLGRAWRNGTTGMCIGASGITTVNDMRGSKDRYGRILQSTVVATGDELAAAASLIMGQGSEGTPIVVAKGLMVNSGDDRAVDIVRPPHEDLFG